MKPPTIHYHEGDAALYPKTRCGLEIIVGETTFLMKTIDIKRANVSDNWEEVDCGNCRRKLVWNGAALYERLEWSESCSGCSDSRESEPSPERGGGCHECGYTGRSRRGFLSPANRAAQIAMIQKAP